MMITDNQQLLITKYLRGTLSEEEQHILSSYLEQNEFKDEFEFQIGLQQAVKLKHRKAFEGKIEQLKQQTIDKYNASPSDVSSEEVNDDLNQDKKKRDDLESDTLSEKKVVDLRSDDPKTKVRSLRPTWISLVAAALVIAISLVFLFLIDSSSTTTIEHLAWAGGTKGDNDLEYREAFEAYEQKEYDRAKSLFNEIPSEEKDEEILLYNAVTLLLLNQEDANEVELTQGIEYLERLSNDTSNYKEVAEWYLAQAYLAKGDENQANILLREIAQNPQHPYASQAQKILE